ncbi:MAG TPA: hypothetical protein VET65_09095 [Candidatus Limnocylindrales bacterium]|nr:hypothetical protein [Candidatus Limnocylindrales bacterium]
MAERDGAKKEGDDEALIRKRLEAAFASSAEGKVRMIRRRRSSGLLYQVRRKTPRKAADL